MCLAMKSKEVVSSIAGHLQGMGHVSRRAIAPCAKTVGSETQWVLLLIVIRVNEKWMRQEFQSYCESHNSCF